MWQVYRLYNILVALVNVYAPYTGDENFLNNYFLLYLILINTRWFSGRFVGLTQVWIAHY